MSHEGPKVDFETQERRRMSGMVDGCKPLEASLGEMLDVQYRPAPVEISLGKRIDNATESADRAREKLCKVMESLGGNMGATECEHMPPIRQNSGLHGKVDDLQETIMFLHNIADTLVRNI